MNLLDALQSLDGNACVNVALGDCWRVRDMDAFVPLAVKGSYPLIGVLRANGYDYRVNRDAAIQDGAEIVLDNGDVIPVEI